LTDVPSRSGIVSELTSVETLRKALECLQLGVHLVDHDHKILFWNEGAERITGFLRQDVVGRFTREDLIASEAQSSDPLFHEFDGFDAVLRDGKHHIADVSMRHREGYWVPVRVRASAIRTEHGTIIGAVECFEESISASEWERRQDKLAGYGALDSATGALTRPIILSHLRENLATYAECHLPFSILCIQVDQLGLMSRNYTPAVIPPILHAVAQSIENSLRPTDFLGRYKNDSLLAVLPECSEFDIGKIIARVRKVAEVSEVRWWGDTLHLKASCGGATVRSEDTLESILERAEKDLIKTVPQAAGLAARRPE